VHTLTSGQAAERQFPCCAHRVAFVAWASALIPGTTRTAAPHEGQREGMTADLSQINQSRGLAWAEHVELGDPCDQCGSIVGDYHVFGWRLAHRSMTPRRRTELCAALFFAPFFQRGPAPAAILDV
jgi:hypothetical protein